MVVYLSVVVLLDDGAEEVEVAVADDFFFFLSDDGDAVLGLQLVVAVAIGYLPAVVGVAEGAGAEADGGGGDAEVVEQGGHDVGLLHDARRDLVAAVGVAEFGSQLFFVEWTVDEHGDAVPAVVVVVFAGESLSAVVGGDDEEGVGVPFGLAGGVEELAEGVVGVGDHAAERVGSFGEVAFMLGLHGVGVVRREGEDAREEGFLEGAELAAEELQEVFVVDAPAAVVVGLAGAAVGHVFVLAVVVLEAELAAELVEIHHAVVAAVEEGGVEAVVAQDGGEGVEVVVGVVAHGQREGHERGDGGEDGGDALDALLAVGAALVDDAVLRQRVEEGGVGAFEVLVVAAHVFLREAFEDDDHDVGIGSDRGGGGDAIDGAEGGQRASILSRVGSPAAPCLGELPQQVGVGCEEGVEEGRCLLLGHEVDLLEGAAVEGAHDVVAAVGHEGAVLSLAVFGGVVPFDLLAEAAAEEEEDEGAADDEAHDVVDAVAAVAVAGGEVYLAAEPEEEHDGDDGEEGGLPVVDDEVGPEGAHVAADAEVAEDLAGEAAVGVLVVGGVAGVGDDDEEHGGVVEQYLGEAVVVLVPTEVEGDEVEGEIGQQHEADGGDAEGEVAGDDAEPFLEAVDMEDAEVVAIEEGLRQQQHEECQHCLGEQVDVYVVGVNPKTVLFHVFSFL